MEDRYTISELADEARKQGIDLGLNPIRTIRYYVSIKLLKKPEIKQEGKKRISYFNKEHLFELKFINFHKKSNLTLQEIKDKLRENMYWSDSALNFIEKYRSEIPDDLFIKNKKITRLEVAFFFSKIMDHFERDKDIGKIVEIMLNAFVDKNGNPLEDVSMLIGGHPIGSEENYS